MPNVIVDICDVMVAAHIKAGYTEASGRHIVVSGEATLLDIADIWRGHFGKEGQGRQGPALVLFDVIYQKKPIRPLIFRFSAQIMALAWGTQAV